MFLLVAFVPLFVLSTPWNIIGFAACLVLFLGELAFWNRRVRGRTKVVGAQRLIGRTARVVTALRPEGQVRLDGEIWAARCDEEAEIGVEVTIVGRERLLL